MPDSPLRSAPGNWQTSLLSGLPSCNALAEPAKAVLPDKRGLRSPDLASAYRFATTTPVNGQVTTRKASAIHGEKTEKETAAVGWHQRSHFNIKDYYE